MPNGKKTRTVSKYKTELGVTYEIMPDGSRRKLNKEEAASVKPRRPSLNNTPQVTKTQEQVKQEMFDANLEALGLDPNQIRADEQKRANRRKKFSNVIQIGDNVANAASETTKNVMQKAQNFKEGFIQKKNNFSNNFKKN